MTGVEIPNRPVFRAQEVCEIAQVQPYVLRTWEAEFPDLGVAKTPNGPRLYRRGDVERVLRIKHLILIDGLTLAGARRQLGERPAGEGSDGSADAELAAFVDGAAQRQLREVRSGLQWILGVLSNGQAASRSDDGPAPDAVTPQDRASAPSRGRMRPGGSAQAAVRTKKR